MKALILGSLLALVNLPVLAQSNVGDLLDKGGKKLTKADYTAMVPLRIKYVWPIGGGEGDLLFQADGTLTGSEYHYGSRSESPATGVWSADEDGKWCSKKHMPVWNSRTDMCYYTYQVGEEFYGALKDERGARFFKIKSVAKQP